MESQHSTAKISIHARHCPADLLIAHQIQHVIVKHDRQNGSLLHHLKNNRSQEDTWHNNCVWWLGGGMLKAGPAWESSQRRLPFQSQRSRWLVVLTEAIWECRPPNSSHAPDHVPPSVLSSARPSWPCAVASALKCETCIDYPIPQPSIATTPDSSKNIGLQLYHTYNILYIPAF